MLLTDLDYKGTVHGKIVANYFIMVQKGCLISSSKKVGESNDKLWKQYVIVVALVIQSGRKSVLGGYGTLQGKMICFTFFQKTMFKDKS